MEHLKNMATGTVVGLFAIIVGSVIGWLFVFHGTAVALTLSGCAMLAGFYGLGWSIRRKRVRLVAEEEG